MARRKTYHTPFFFELILAAFSAACGGRTVSGAAVAGSDAGAEAAGDANAGAAIGPAADGSYMDSNSGSNVDDGTAPSPASAADAVAASAPADGALRGGVDADPSVSPASPADAQPKCSCRSCCDALGNCQVGADQDAHCGSPGALCVDCTALGGACVVGGASGPHCMTADGGTLCSQTCDGCCEADGTCHSGFADKQCGEAGGRCQDCTSLASPSTCDLGSSPRACTSAQAQCPAPYGGCPAALQSPPNAPQSVCSAVEIQGAATACSDGPTTLSCRDFMTSESASDSACAACLRPFAVDFSKESGVVACASAYIAPECDHSSACLADCVARTCGACLDSESTARCATQVESGTCSTYLQADGCMAQALSGPASLCNPGAYQDHFGPWLEAVATHYCGR